MSNKTKHAPHKHLYENIGPARGAWDYRCTVCGTRSRNPLYQDPAFRGEPVTVRSVVMDFTTGTGKVFEWQTQLDAGVVTPGAGEGE